MDKVNTLKQLKAEVNVLENETLKSELQKVLVAMEQTNQTKTFYQHYQSVTEKLSDYYAQKYFGYSSTDDFSMEGVQDMQSANPGGYDYREDQKRMVELRKADIDMIPSASYRAKLEKQLTAVSEAKTEFDFWEELAKLDENLDMCNGSGRAELIEAYQSAN